MNYRKHRVHLLRGLLVTALGMMAFASSAQAVVPEFVIDEVKALHASVGTEQLGSSYLLVPALGFEMRCVESFTPEGLLLEGQDGNHAIAHVKILYMGCTLLALVGLGLLPCEVYASATDPRPHVTLEALLLPVHFGGNHWGVLAEKVKATVLLKGPECPLPLSGALKGEMCFLIHENQSETVKPFILTKQSIQESCPERPTLESLSTGAGVKDKLLYGAQTAIMDMAAEFFLTGAHSGQKLGVLLL